MLPMGTDGSRRNRRADTGRRGRGPGVGDTWILYSALLSLGRSVVIVDWVEVSR